MLFPQEAHANRVMVSSPPMLKTSVFPFLLFLKFHLTGQGFVSHDMISLSVHAGIFPPIYEHRKEAKHMSKKWAAVIISLLVISLGLSAVSLAVSLRQPQKQSGDIQYVLYLGTNDKDTNQPVYPPEEAKENAKEILIRNFGGYTIQEANGGWIDDENTVYQEYTLVIYLSDTTIDKVHAAADEMIRTFNQSSVLIQANETKTEFYAGVN